MIYYWACNFCDFLSPPAKNNMGIGIKDWANTRTHVRKNHPEVDDTQLALRVVERTPLGQIVENPHR